MSTESDLQRKKRLKRFGVWEEYGERRSELQASGYSVAQYTQMLAKEFDKGSQYWVPENPEAGQHCEGDFPPELELERAVESHHAGRTVPASCFDGKPEITQVASIRWVAEHLYIQDVAAENCPSMATWSLYQYAKVAGNVAAFFDKIWTKTLPSRADLERMEKFKDDGRKTLDLIEVLRQDAGDQVSGG